MIMQFKKLAEGILINISFSININIEICSRQFFGSNALSGFGASGWLKWFFPKPAVVLCESYGFLAFKNDDRLGTADQSDGRFEAMSILRSLTQPRRLGDWFDGLKDANVQCKCMRGEI